MEVSEPQEEKLLANLNLVRHHTTAADDNGFEQYFRNYNLCLDHLHQPDGETLSRCEDAVLKLFHHIPRRRTSMWSKIQNFLNFD